MAMMAKMRSLAPAFIISVGVLFVLFMVISDSSVMEALGGGRTNNVGSINGEDISYQDFSKILDQQRESQKNQTGKDIDEDNMGQFRDQVWDAIVTQKLLGQQIKKYGITVSDQEIRDIILSDNPPDFLKRNFIDSTGKFNEQAYKQAIYDPQNSAVLIQAEDVVRQQRLTQKLQSMLQAAVTVSEAEIRRRFIDNNTQINSKYALISYSNFPDSSISVSESEMKNYYDENQDKYKVEAQRKLKYVIFQTTPSADDSEGVRLNLENVVSSFKKDTASFKSYVGIYSSEPYSKDTVEIVQLPPDAQDSIINAKPGQLVGPVAGNSGYTLYHLVAKLSSKNTFIKASHILINKGNDEANYKEAMNIYHALINGADFAKLAKQNSADVGSAVKGGDLGWFGKGRMVPEFEKACFSGKVGVVQKPIKTKYGYHIIKVTGKIDKKFVVEKIVSPVKTSAATKDARKGNASDYSYLAKKNDFTKEAELVHYNIRETAPFTKNSNFIPGIGLNKRLMDFAFDNDLGDVSDAFSVQNGYVVAKISAVMKERVKTFDEVKKQIKTILAKKGKEEKAEALAEKIKSQIANDLDKASSVDPNVKVETTGEFTPSDNIPGVGKDYAFIDKCMDADLNKVTSPVKGLRGYYLIDVTSRTPFDTSKYQIQRNNLRDKIYQEKRASFFQEWLANLRKNADIVDNRYLFYGG
ncbi:MAG: peptidylprolyl isomerase [Ignavibacteriaceae bacterium]|jgi:parvulin-like peptidyl-prolyl isomerase